MDKTAIFYAFLSAVLMGTIGVFSKLTGLPAEIITFFRLLLGSGFMILFLSVNKKTQLVRVWPTWPVIINGALLAAFIIFYVQAMNYTTMANAIMLVYLAPLFASIFAHFFMDERLSFTSFSLICLSLFGFGMVMGFDIEFSRDSEEFIGICYGLLAIVSYAGFMLINRIINENIHVYTRTFWQLFIGGCVMIPSVLFSMLEVGAGDAFWLLGVGFFPGFLAILFAVVALSRLPVATFGTIAYTEPVAVVIFGWTIFNETLGVMQVAGCGVIICCGVLKTIVAEKYEK